MPETQHYIAVDLGAESGRVMLGTLSDDNVAIAEAHRFPNGPIELAGTLRWDFDRLLAEVKRGIATAVGAAGGVIHGLGVDSWGVDFGLLDDRGVLLEPPYHYRDSRTIGVMEEAFRRIPRREIYERTGIQFMQINTLYQLFSMRLRGDSILDKARKMTFIADLVSHSLCGRLYAEYTLASTSQMLDMRTGRWATSLLETLEIPPRILPEVVPPATPVGKSRDEIAEDLRSARLPIIATASHDTAAAVAAVPAAGGSWAYLSSGTWSLMGVESPEPVITDRTCELGFTNEGGVEGTIRLLKNIIGLWIVQECRRQWQREGKEFTYADLTSLAARAVPFAAILDPTSAEFLPPGDMPRRINEYLERTGQRPLREPGAMVRAILEGLALTYRKTLEEIECVTGRKIETLHIVGGGTQNELLNQFAADATNRRVLAGPVEATSLGNVLLQARALGRIRSLGTLRAIVRSSQPVREYLPRDPESWDRQYAAFRRAMKQ